MTAASVHRPVGSSQCNRLVSLCAVMKRAQAEVRTQSGAGKALVALGPPGTRHLAKANNLNVELSMDQKSCESLRMIAPIATISTG